MSLNIDEGRDSPQVVFDPHASYLLVKGISTLADPRTFYRQVLDWLDKNEKELKDDTVFEFNLPYFNSGNNKCIFHVLEKLNSHLAAGKHYKIIWCVEDDDEFMQESGEAMSEILDMPLIYKTVPFNSGGLF